MKETFIVRRFCPTSTLVISMVWRFFRRFCAEIVLYKEDYRMILAAATDEKQSRRHVTFVTKTTYG